MYFVLTDRWFVPRFKNLEHAETNAHSKGLQTDHSIRYANSLAAEDRR